MFPLRDENPRVHPPIATIAIIALNAFAWIVLQGFGNDPALAASICKFGLIPGDVLGTAPAGSSFAVSHELVCVLDGDGSYLNVLTSMFMHGGWFHIVGNLWFLWIFGDNVEDAMGSARFAAFYVLCGIGAAVAQMLTDTSSIVPMVGASGAIGGVMGAYALLYPRAHIHTFIFLGFYMTTVAVPAVFMLGYWFLLQVLGGLPATAGEGGGVAFWAHIGGFLAGVVLVYLFTDSQRLSTHRQQATRRTSRHRWF
ncbi:MAG: rhomboid family intramembrane serine protease [Gammaproteobacteria bacterium]|nr:rhomboid family intramembrane serine protease [Gammaproteobacteria bacterium]